MVISRLAAVLCASALSSSTIAQSLRPDPPFSGIGRAKDGDSLMVGNREVRLFGIDAPELDQTCDRARTSWDCGREANRQLSGLVTGRDVQCVRVSADQYARAVSRCTVGTVDINSAMVASGLAVAYRRYSNDYVAVEARAKAAQRGLWSGTFEMPNEYRIEHRERNLERHQRQVRPAARTSSRSNDWAHRSQCNIKGNQNRKGQRIYHLPGMPYYDQSRPEQIFCSEAEALAAGYRRVIVKN